MYVHVVRVHVYTTCTFYTRDGFPTARTRVNPPVVTVTNVVIDGSTHSFQHPRVAATVSYPPHIGTFCVYNAPQKSSVIIML